MEKSYYRNKPALTEIHHYNKGKHIEGVGLCGLNYGRSHGLATKAILYLFLSSVDFLFEKLAIFVSDGGL
tara:strand:- start:707 stop:916 length:210 start_codon:yes stop_codon:yes gene_type:complete